MAGKTGKSPIMAAAPVRRRRIEMIGTCGRCRNERMVNIWGWCIFCWCSVFSGEGAPDPVKYFEGEE